MTNRPQKGSITDQMIEIFQNGEKYTTNELTELLHSTRKEKHFAMLKRQVNQCISHLKAGSLRVDIPPMDIQKLEDDDGIKRWRLIL